MIQPIKQMIIVIIFFRILCYFALPITFDDNNCYGCKSKLIIYPILEGMVYFIDAIGLWIVIHMCMDKSINFIRNL
jgi:hypothetical protein